MLNPRSTSSLLPVIVLSMGLFACTDPGNDVRATPQDSASIRGQVFLSENKNKTGVVTLPSGLQYKVIRAGTGRQPGYTNSVTVHYRGRLIDGTEFDSSYKRGQPAAFPVNRVIPGWTQALQLMKEGAKWELYIPPVLAYGARGAGPLIGPNETLIFEVELISVNP